MDKRRGWSQSAGYALLVLLGACGGSVTEDTSDEQPIAQSDLAAVFASAVCDSRAPCCRASGFAYDATTCEARSGYIAGLLQFANDGFETYDPVLARQCVDAWVAASRTCSIAAFSSANPLAVCARIITGTQSLGNTCHTQLDCATPATNCETDQTGEPRCAAALVHPQHGQLGDACALSCSGECAAAIPSHLPSVACYAEDGLVCDSASQTCAPPAALGGDCTSRGCGANTHCQAGRCVAREASGACGNAQDPACAAGSYCDGTHCQLQFADGSACHPGSNECQHQCDPSPSAALPVAIEPPDAGATTGTCAPSNLVNPRECGAAP